MDKKSYINQEIIRLLQSWGSLASAAGAVVIMALSLLDYFVTPENFSKFLIYRLITTFLFSIIFLLTRQKGNKYFYISLFIVATIIVSIMVELMILSSGGHKSIYYVGMIIVFIISLGFLPLISLRTTIILAAVIYFIYLLPILIVDDITNNRIFINNNIFLITAAITAITWRYYNDKLLIKNLSLEYDLSKDKEQLKIYSSQLEDLVAERTKELSISEKRFRALFDYANDGVVVLDKNGIILNMNQKFCELHGFGKEALIGTHIRLLESGNNEGEKKERMNRILNGEAMVFETEHCRKDGTKISLEVSSKAIEIEGELYIQSLHRDITEKKKLQEQLYQSQKMESIGILAGGIAHDFNNILTAILGHAELLHEFDNLGEPALKKVKIIENSARRAGQIVTKLLSFARKGSSEILPISLSDVINDTLELIGKTLKNKKIDIKMQIDDRITTIYGDSNQIEQVVMNLILNAADVMPDGGTITLSASLEDLQKRVVHVSPLLTPGKYVNLKISDTGKGIPDEIKGRIFEPFFTTKGNKGTGLGLAIVYGIVKEHGGVINVESQLGMGTTFEIYLPAFERIGHKIERPSPYSMTGKENILVVDDEAEILSFIKETFEKQGYRVLVTDNPIYALDIFKQIHDNIDLVITDIIMPLVNGRELIRHFKTIKPEVGIIAISGYERVNTGKKDGDIDAFIGKPLESIYLLSVVRRVLDSKVKRGVDKG